VNVEYFKKHWIRFASVNVGPVLVFCTAYMVTNGGVRLLITGALAMLLMNLIVAFGIRQESKR
jgi:hypothetical protein